MLAFLTPAEVAARRAVSFVVSTGDDFYPRGVTNASDEQFESKWRARYAVGALKKLEWYNILGDHDCYGNVSAIVEPFRDPLTRDDSEVFEDTGVHLKAAPNEAVVRHLIAKTIGCDQSAAGTAAARAEHAWGVRSPNPECHALHSYGGQSPRHGYQGVRRERRRRK